MVDLKVAEIQEEHKIILNRAQEFKNYHKKWKDDMLKLNHENANLKKKVVDQTRLVEKVRLNSLQFHRDKAAVRHRELEYFTKRDFTAFQVKLRDSFEILIKMSKEAFKRDAKIAMNLMESHLHPSGKGLLVRTEVHTDIKMFRMEVLKKGFQRPAEIPIYIDDNLSTFAHSDAEEEVIADIKCLKSDGVRKRERASIGR